MASSFANVAPVVARRLLALLPVHAAPRTPTAIRRRPRGCARPCRPSGETGACRFVTARQRDHRGVFDDGRGRGGGARAGDRAPEPGEREPCEPISLGVAPDPLPPASITRSRRTSSRGGTTSLVTDGRV